MRRASLAAVLIIALLVSLAILTPSVLVCPCDTPAGEKKGCSSCHDTPQAQVANFSFIQLEGPDLHKAVAEALADDQVKTLRLALINDENTPKTDGAVGYEMELESGPLLVVILPFEGEADVAVITYLRYNDAAFAFAATFFMTEEGKVYAVFYYVEEDGTVAKSEYDDFWCCVGCAISCGVGCGTFCLLVLKLPPAVCAELCVGGCAALCSYVCGQPC